MSLTEKESATMRRYDANAAEWLEYSGGPDRKCFWEGEMEVFQNLIQGHKVIELGCGPATDGKYLRKSGLTVSSIDYSKGMLDLAKKLGTNDILTLADMYALPFESNGFDGFWATASLLHLEKPQKALSEIHRVTSNQGVGFITVKEGEGVAVDPRTGYLFRYFGNLEFQKVLMENRMQVLSVGRKNGTKDHDWLMYLVKVNK